jgi:undecaprenyl-diphosphatase
MSILAYVQHSDLRVSVRMCRWGAPRWFRRLMLFLTRLGDGWLWPLALATLAQVLGLLPALRRFAFGAALANLSLIVLKHACRRSRPAEMGLAIGSPHFAPELLTFDQFSFPSGHSLNAFAAATILASGASWTMPLAVLVAGGIAASRVFLGRHFLGDVIAGAAIGVAIGAVVVLSGI